MKINKNILLAGLVVAAGLFVARPSSAQLQAGGSLGTLNSLNQTEGTFSVLASQASAGSDLWNVTVTWVSNGSAAPAGGAFLDNIDLILNSGGTVSGGQVTGGTGQTISLLSGSVNGTNWVTSQSSPVQAVFKDPGTFAGGSATAPVNSTESFTGTIDLTGASSPITAVQFIISNTGSGEEWFGTTATPEGSSFALLLPGLIPLGLMLRRRRKA